MTAPPHVIRDEIWIAAPIETVWLAISTPEHLAGWFSDEAEFEARAGAEGHLTWRSHGTFPLRVEEIAPPHLLAFRWLRREVGTLRPASTLVRLVLSEGDGGTTVRVTETGFDTLPWDREEAVTYTRENVAGWRTELSELKEYVQGTLAAHRP